MLKTIVVLALPRYKMCYIRVTDCYKKALFVTDCYKKALFVTPFVTPFVTSSSSKKSLLTYPFLSTP